MKHAVDAQGGVCQRCNIYHVTCLGEKFEQVEKSTRMKCADRVHEPDNTPSPVQVEAFTSLHRSKVRGGLGSLAAFVEAIVQTSDDVYTAALRKKPDLIEKYYRHKNMRHQNQGAMDCPVSSHTG